MLWLGGAETDRPDGLAALRIFAQQSRKDPKGATTSAHDKFLGPLKDDILKLDLAELDFGIYRILNYRRREIETFLDRELPLKIDAALAIIPGAAGEDEQGRIFHHLYTFFSRYYDDGDFVTRPRRRRNAAYSVPYNGQDVHFWWATKGSHYVESGERFASYVWRDGAGPRKAKVPGGVDKSLLKKHVARYVAGQTSDFFVHPQLGEFLNGELEYYLKDEFMQVWDRADGAMHLRASAASSRDCAPKSRKNLLPLTTFCLQGSTDDYIARILLSLRSAL
jgi:hypothetical protein